MSLNNLLFNMKNSPCMKNLALQDRLCPKPLVIGSPLKVQFERFALEKEERASRHACKMNRKFTVLTARNVRLKSRKCLQLAKTFFLLAKPACFVFPKMARHVFPSPRTLPSSCLEKRSAFVAIINRLLMIVPLSRKNLMLFSTDLLTWRVRK
jgi:hypothetical protein